MLSRIDGFTPWSVLLEIGGLTPQEVEACLSRWLSQGIVICDGLPPGCDSSRDPSGEATSREGEIAAHLDIPVEEQREILAFEAGLDRSYWEVLGVAVDADGRNIKRAYFKLSRRFHPDRYYRREIGEFAARLTRIFKRLVEAYELLSDPQTRAELRRSMGEIPLPQGGSGESLEAASSGEDATAQAASVHGEQEAASVSASAGDDVDSGAEPTKRERQRHVLERLRRHFQIPEKVLAERRFQAGQFYQAAMVAMHKKNVKEAASVVRLAIAFDPWNPEYKEGFAEVLAQAHQLQAEELLEKAALDGRSQAQALKLMEEALHYRPCDPEINDKAARMALELRELDRAREYAESACELAPRESSYQGTLGRVLRSMGLADKARGVLEEALRLDPKNEEAQRELKQIKRSKRRR